jgi:capsule polysaccharide export protein KpsE/RkpR
VKPPSTIMAGVLGTAWFRNPMKRRLTFAVIGLVLGVLCVWPQRYMARADLLPQDSAGGLSALLGQSGGGGLASLSALLGSHQSIEADLTMARSQAVLRSVIARMHLVGRRGFGQAGEAEIKIRRKVDIAAIRGSILQITVRDADPVFAKGLVAAYVDSVQESLTVLTLRQSAQKRAVAESRLNEASTRVAGAQAALARFRSENKLAAPEAQLGAGVSELAALQGALQAKQVELQTVRQFATGANVRVQAVEAEIAGLQNQISAAQTASRGQYGPNLAAMALQSSEYLNLYRDERFAAALYAVYTRFLEQVTVDELSANANMDVIEPPYVDPGRQFNVAPMGLLIVIVVLAFGAEYYIARPPVGRRE